MSDFFIQRVQVEGGFLDGFDLNLKDGLNTIIGARGTGKSTFIELIRYGLNIKGHNAESNNKSLNHALSVLKDGQVTITLSHNDDFITITRSPESELDSSLPTDINKPLIFSQTEIETIGLLSSGRLNIIDNFIDNIKIFNEKETNKITKINAISKELYYLSEEIDNFEEKIIPLNSLHANLQGLEEQLEFASESSGEIADKTLKLDQLSKEYNEYIYKLKYMEKFNAYETNWIEDLKKLAKNIPEVENWRENSENPVSNILDKRNKLKNTILNSLNDYYNELKNNDAVINNVQSKISDITKNGQVLRKEVDSLKSGLGELSRNILNLKKEINQLENLKLTLEEKKQKIKLLQNERNIYLDELDAIRSERSYLREQICNKISISLSPKINIKIELASQIDDYTNILIKGLKGSGIQYTDIVSLIAESIPPRELINIIENNNIKDFISFVAVTENRAFKLINTLKGSIQDIATVLLEDKISFYLNDGTEWKDFSELSTGQRCTVILPIILEHKNTILIIDQPEDHIDNAFIVETLINSIKKRKKNGQTILTTHNANLPVLGHASIVAHLESDGKRGFIKSFGELNNPQIVDAISNIMEGGKQAFKDRSDFYGI